MTILTLLILLAPALLGIVSVVLSRAVEEKVTAALVGTTAGFASFTTVVYVLTLWLPLTPSLLWVLGLATAAGAAALCRGAWPLWRELPLDRTALWLLVAASLIFGNIAPKLLLEQPDGLYTGIINAYGDVAWHLSNITTFAAGQTAPPENPIFSDTTLTYPFMINFFSALVLVGGASLSETVTIPALVLIPLLLVLLYRLVYAVTDNKTAAILAMLLFLLGGATLGWTRIIGDWQESNQPVATFLTHLPNRYYSGVGVDEQGFHWLNPVTSLLLPQRSLLLGFPLAFSLLLILAGRHSRPLPYALAGVLAGITPLFHAHTVVALVPAIIGLCILEARSKDITKQQLLTNWGTFAIVALLIGIPEVAYYLRGTSTAAGSFFRWGPGWLSGEMNLLWYWFINTGLLIPLIIAGLFTPAPARLKVLAAAGLLLFGAANLFLFAPWAWDNFKLFIYFFIFSLPLASYVIAQHLTRATSPVAVALIVLLLGLHMLSASLDLWKISLPTATAWIEWQTDEIVFANQIRAITEPGASIVTAPNHNSPVVLSGRPRYLGYAAHVWSHGLAPWNREAALPDFYEGRRTTLPEATPDYVFVGRAERATYPGLIIQPTWELVVQNGALALYRLPR